VKDLLLLLALGLVKTRVRYEPGPPMSNRCLRVEYKVLSGREYVMGRNWVPCPKSNVQRLMSEEKDAAG